MTVLPSGFNYSEYYLYAEKAWEMAPPGVAFYELEHPALQNAPIVVTSSGSETTSASDPWGQVSGSGKYQKVGYGYFRTDSDGSYNESVDEFSLHPDSSGMLVFNKALLENVYIEYESGPSGHYILDAVDYNPLRGEASDGFVHFSKATDPKSIYLSTSQNDLYADGNQRAKLTATILDGNNDRLPDKNIIFELMDTDDWSENGYLDPYRGTKGTVIAVDASGYAIELRETTNNMGQAFCRFITHPRKPGIQDIKAYYESASGVYDIVQINNFYYQIGPFLLDSSLLDFTDYLV